LSTSVQEIKLSIALPVYNFANFIPDTLTSILSQEHGDEVEIVVTDGASTDNTPELMAAFCAKYQNIIYNRLPAKGGIDVDMAKAVEATHGDYVWIFSGDDIMHDGSLAYVLEKIQSDDDVYICKHMECTAWMEPLCEYPLLEPDVPGVFELSDDAQRLLYFQRACNSEAFFSFCSGLILRRTTWDRGSLDDDFIGTCWAHSARLFSLMKSGLRVHYLARPLLSRRGGNDSFSDKGLIERYRIQVEGFHDIVEAVFGRKSPEAREVRRAIRNEFHPTLIMILKFLSYLQPKVEDRRLLTKLVARAYRDLTWDCIKVRLTYALIPISAIQRKYKMHCDAYAYPEAHKKTQDARKAVYLSANGSKSP